MCGYSAGSQPVRKRTREDIVEQRARFATDVDYAQMRFDELDRELREWDKARDAALSAEPVEVKP
jgi:hypothetical protein